MFDFKGAENSIGYSFKDKELLTSCFTHSSFVNEHKGAKDNERLEFLGDSVLGFIVGEYLYKKFGDKKEGKLTVERQKLVSDFPLSRAAEKFGFDRFLLRGNGQPLNASIRENLFEAIVAGIYLDGGIDEAKRFVDRFLLSDSTEEVENYIGELQELASKKKFKVEYKEISNAGPDHKKTFVYRAVLSVGLYADGSGGSIKKAKAAAAKAALEQIKSEEFFT